MRWFVITFLVVGFVCTAHAQFPTPKSRPAAVETTQQVAPPAPQPVVVSAPAAAPSATAGWSFMDVMMVIWTVLGGGGVGAYLKQVFLPSKPATLQPPQNITDLLKSFDPATRKQMDALLLQIVTDVLNKRVAQ